MAKKSIEIVCLFLLAGGAALGFLPESHAWDNRRLKSEISSRTDLIMPSSFEYLGAFRLPGHAEDLGWEYSGEAMCYFPKGDPDGPDDGYPGSLFATGHNWYQRISEMSIPNPIISEKKDLDTLNTATTLQDFHDIHDSLFEYMEIPRAGLEYLPRQGQQNTDKLYFCWAPHMGEGETNPSHGWCELNLSEPRPAGPWRISEFWNYVTADYLFAIPRTWAEANLPGRYLATGRFRDGGQGAQGPSLFAINPWNEGNPPPPGSTIPAVPLLLYSDVYSTEEHVLTGYHHSDEWSGGAWLTEGSRAAVIFVGTKGLGQCWYGFANGVVWPDDPPYPPIPPPPYDERGWWSTSFEGRILFYDPSDLSAVAGGRIPSWQPQPYAILNIDSYLFHFQSEQQKSHVGDAAYDRDRGLLYILEPLADNDKSIVHVWGIGSDNGNKKKRRVISR